MATTDTLRGGCDHFLLRAPRRAVAVRALVAVQLAASAANRETARVWVGAPSSRYLGRQLDPPRAAARYRR